MLVIHDPAYIVRGVSLEPYQRWGSLGVVLFFAISGILIPWRILEEETLTGRFHLKLFYIRRLFRIQPAAWAYLAVIAVLVLIGVLHEAWTHWFAALFLYENFLYHETVANEMKGFFTGHFWTLAVEEHYYLLVSLLFFFVRRRRLRIFFGLLIAVKTAQLIGYHFVSDPLLRRTYWQIHILLWPTLAAIALRKPAIRAQAERWLQPWIVFALTAIVGLVLVRAYGIEHLPMLLSYSFTLWVAATMLHGRSWSTRALEWAPLRFIGRISYSLYLWHPLFYSAIAHPPVSSRLLIYLSNRPVKYLCTFAVAVASYYLLEKPLIRLGHRLAPPATPGHRDLADEPTLATSSQ